MSETAGCSRSHQERPRPRRPRRRRRAKIPLSPSPTLLALLASISPSSTFAEASPLHFLCPFVDYSPLPTLAKRATKKPKPAPTLPPDTSAVAAGKPLADRFVKGDDGIWTKVENYSLYGLTMCTDCSHSTAVVSELLEDVNYPKGWGDNGMKSAKTEIVAAISLALSFVICLLMIGCLFWRKHLRRIRRQHDLERKMKGKRKQRKRSPTPSQFTVEDNDSGEDEQLTSTSRTWSRAAACWRENARYTARQRRGRRRTAASAPNSLRERSVSTVRTSHTLSRRPSLSSIPDHDTTPAVPSTPAPSPQDNHLPHSSASDPEDTRAVSPPPPPHSSRSSSPPPHLPSSPPAYRPRSLQQSGVTTHAPQTIEDQKSSATPNLGFVRRHASETFVLPNSSSTSGPVHGSSTIPIAHVATDDKTVLARLNQAASAPSDEVVPGAQESSAPDWHDAELEVLEATATSLSDSPDEVPTHSAFPPPPSKGKLPASFSYSYPFYESTSDLGHESSAPPFEAHATQVPSAPPIEDDNFNTAVASAPPPEFEDVATSLDEHGGTSPAYDTQTPVR